MNPTTSDFKTSAISKFPSEYLQPGSMVSREGYGHVDCGIFNEAESRSMFDNCVKQCIIYYNNANPTKQIPRYPKVMFVMNKMAGMAYFHIDNYAIWHLLVHLDENGETPKEQVLNPDFKMPTKPAHEAYQYDSRPLIEQWSDLIEHECSWDDYTLALEDAKILINKNPNYKAPERKLTAEEHNQLITKRMTDAKFEYYNFMKQKGDERFINLEVRDVFNLKLSQDMEDKIRNHTPDSLSIKITAARVSSHERKDEIKACELFAFVPSIISDNEIYNVMKMHNTSSHFDSKNNRLKFPYISSSNRVRADGMRPVNVVFDYHTRDARFALLINTMTTFTDKTGKRHNIKFSKSKEKN